jgi:hypothetical protein
MADDVADDDVEEVERLITSKNRLAPHKPLRV